MIAKTFEIRDDKTFIPVLAVKLNPENESDRYLIARAGYGQSPVEQGAWVLILRLSGGHVQVDIDGSGESWNRTMTVANRYIREHFDTLDSGEVVDVEFILGEKSMKKVSERVSNHASSQKEA